MEKVTIGGERLGSGKKNKAELHGYERSTHDLSYIWRSTMASGTLVPFMTEVGLPGDTFDIKLDADVKTHPTIGPLFGSYKVQLDVFTIPIRLYNGKLHMNKLNIGLKMSDIKLPQMKLETYNGIAGDDNNQINPSALLNYLNIRGVGRNVNLEPESKLIRYFNGVPLLAYWDIYKQYYANKQEEIGAFIHNTMNPENIVITDITLNGVEAFEDMTINSDFQTEIVLTSQGNDEEIRPENVFISFDIIGQQGYNVSTYITEVFDQFVWDEVEGKLYCTQLKNQYWGDFVYKYITYDNSDINTSIPQVKTFDLANIDKMREEILSQTTETSAFIIDVDKRWPYGAIFELGEYGYSNTSTQEGLGLKTYQSDLFNNWISTEWIDGTGGISEITAVDTSAGYLTIDSLNLSEKVYKMLNRIAISGGTYDDWIGATYATERIRGVENPVYMGGLIKELAFQEVVSNASTESNQGQQPLGTLAGRGVLTSKNKGGNVYVKVDEPSYIMGIISLTPRVDYSQGNKWDVNLKTLDDLHKPQLDEIGFQDLLTDQMAYWDTNVALDGTITYKSAGKVPAWINYMTNVNQTKGNFAIESQQMYMTLNRRYEEGIGGIKDLTTYIDPSKFNNIFADTRLDAQNFWAQISVDIEARRKMSAKIMPNL